MRCEACARGHKKCVHQEPRSHCVIPDSQIRPGVPMEHMLWISQYIADKRPSVVLHLGDHWDLSSLSSYDKGKKCFEGRRYKADIAAGNEAMDMLTSRFRDIPDYKPEMHFTTGNHEFRCERAVESQAELEGVIGMHDMNLQGWTVHPFLQPVEIDGVEYAHFFTSGVMGRPVSSAAALLRARMNSATMGHVQMRDSAIHPKTNKRGLFAGISYTHLESYLGNQGNTTRPQIIFKHEVHDGEYDLMEVSIDFLRRRYS